MTEMTMPGTMTMAPAPQYAFSFFNLSYLYLTLFTLIVGFVVATVVSLLTGKFFIFWTLHNVDVS